MTAKRAPVARPSDLRRPPAILQPGAVGCFFHLALSPRRTKVHQSYCCGLPTSTPFGRPTSLLFLETVWRAAGCGAMQS